MLPPQAFQFQGDGRRPRRGGFQTLSEDGLRHALFWTYQVNKGRSPSSIGTSPKGIAVRLDPGPWRYFQGETRILYDEDTMRVAAAYEGEFVDWRGIAFDGSHGTHTSIKGDPILTTPDQLAWQNPKTKDWEDRRIIGRDGRRFGPLPRSWVQYLLFQHGVTKRSCITEWATVKSTNCQGASNMERPPLRRGP